MPTLLIIGGSGFFGKSILDCYKRKLLDPWGIERVEVVSRNASNLAHHHPELISKDVFLHNLDIRNCEKLPKAEYIIYAATSSDAKQYLISKNTIKEEILQGIKNFSKIACNYFQNSKILFTSSGAVYGHNPNEKILLAEEMPLKSIKNLPQNKQIYAAAKRESEDVFKKLSKLNIQVSIARCFTFYGKYLPRDQHFAFGNFLNNCLNKRPIIVKADKPVFRSYMYSDALINYLMQIIINSNIDCPTVNVGSNEILELRELAKLMADYFNTEIIFEFPICSNSSIDFYVPSTINLERKFKAPLEESILSNIANFV
jgi:dTDP-glucose 4,6-dehydratase